jgi:hypothetical protein
LTGIGNEDVYRKGVFMRLPFLLRQMICSNKSLELDLSSHFCRFATGFTLGHAAKKNESGENKQAA